MYKCINLDGELQGEPGEPDGGESGASQECLVICEM